MRMRLIVKKGEQKVQGYSANITDTWNNDNLNLITDVQVEKANHADNDFLQKAVEQSEKVVGHIENVNADGAYHSPDNQEFAKNNSTSLVVGNIPAAVSLPGCMYTRTSRLSVRYLQWLSLLNNILVKGVLFSTCIYNSIPTQLLQGALN